MKVPKPFSKAMKDNQPERGVSKIERNPGAG